MEGMVMALQDRINALYEQGIKTDIKHYREYNDQHEPEPKGGATIVDLFDEEGNCVATGTSHCSYEDNYNRSLGANIALGRAEHELFGRKKNV
jgi:hypothetical protein